MTTAVDTNVLLDLLLPDQDFANASEQALFEASQAGLVVISEPVYAELAALMSEAKELDQFLASSGIEFHASSREALELAGSTWRQYAVKRRVEFACPNCGSAVRARCEKCGTFVTRRQHVLADFMIGAHALVHAGRLLTRDRGYYATYYPSLTIV